MSTQRKSPEVSSHVYNGLVKTNLSSHSTSDTSSAIMKPTNLVSPTSRKQDDNDDGNVKMAQIIQQLDGTFLTHDLANQIIDKNYTWLDLSLEQILLVVSEIEGVHSFLFTNIDLFRRELGTPTSISGLPQKLILWWNLTNEQKELVQYKFYFARHMFESTTSEPTSGPMSFQMLASHLKTLEVFKPFSSGDSHKTTRFRLYECFTDRKQQTGIKIQQPEHSDIPFIGSHIYAATRDPSVLASLLDMINNESPEEPETVNAMIDAAMCTESLDTLNHASTNQ